MLKRLRLAGYAGLEHVSPFPQEIFTGTGTDPRPRLRTEAGHSSFHEGREFRIQQDISIAANSTYIIRADFNYDVILRGMDLCLDVGYVRVQTILGGTFSGTFSDILTTHPCNTMSARPSPSPTSMSLVREVTTGGNTSGGSSMGSLKVRVPTGTGSVFTASVGNNDSDMLGLGAGSYYFRFTTGTDASSGIFRLRWAEQESASTRIVSY